MSLTLREKLHALLPMTLAYMASGGSLVASSAAQLVTFAVLARFLGVEQFGLYAAITALTSIAVQMVGLGSNEALVRRVAQDRTMYPVMLGHSLIISAASGGVLFLIGMLILPATFPVAESTGENLIAIGLILGTNILVLKLIGLSTQSFVAHSDFGSANRIELLFAFVRTGTAILACVGFGVSSVAQWAYWHFAGHAVVAAVALYAMRPLGRPRFHLQRDEIRNGLLFSTQFIFRAVRQNADLLVLAAVSGAEIVGSYSIARRILDSSYLSVEALNRLIYPGSAAIAANGLHKAFDRTKRVLVASVVIASGSATAIFLLAGLLPVLFGEEYVSLVGFTRIMCWIVVPMAMYGAALEALGASGLQGLRAALFNSANLLGSLLIALATWVAAVPGTFAANYAVEIALVVASWVVLHRVVRRHRNEAAAGAASSLQASPTG